MTTNGESTKPAKAKREFPKPPEEARCTALSKNTGERCQMWKLHGFSTCRAHTSTGAISSYKAKQERVARQLSKDVRFRHVVIREDDPAASPIAALDMELRRTLARIEYYGDRIEALTEEQLTWSVAEETTMDGDAGMQTGNVSTRTTVYRQELNALVQAQDKERDRLLAIEKIWIGARLGEAHLEVQRQAVQNLDVAITRIITKLGKDVHDPEVKQVIRGELLALTASDVEITT